MHERGGDHTADRFAEMSVGSSADPEVILQIGEGFEGGGGVGCFDGGAKVGVERGEQAHTFRGGKGQVKTWSLPTSAPGVMIQSGAGARIEPGQQGAQVLAGHVAGQPEAGGALTDPHPGSLGRVVVAGGGGRRLQVVGLAAGAEGSQREHVRPPIGSARTRALAMRLPGRSRRWSRREGGSGQRQRRARPSGRR